MLLIRRGLMLAACALLLAACARDDARPPAATSTAAESAPPVTITWSFWGDSWEQAVNARLIRAFERDHPGIRVQPVHRPWAQYFEFLRAEWRAGRSPDVMFLNYIPSYAAYGELELLDPFLTRDAVSQDGYYPALLDGFKVQGRLYGLPRDNDTKVIFYNRVHFQQAGLTPPWEGWTWDDLRTAAAALSQPDARQPRYGFGFETAYWWLVWLWQNGGDVLDDPLRPTSVTLGRPESVAALEFMRRLIHEDRVTPPPAQMTTEQMVTLFREGRLSMLWGNHALVPAFTETAGLSWDVAPLPAGTERANVAGGAGFVISSRSREKEAAWQLVKFLTGPKGQALFAESGVITPARRAVSEDNIFIRQQPFNSRVFVSETEHGRPVPNFPGVTDMHTLIDSALAPVWRGEQSVAQALAGLLPELNRLLGFYGP